MTEIPAFIIDALGRSPRDPGMFERALTHGSHGGETYERLEFLGDRVLGLVVASWLYERFPNEPEGKMSRRYNALVARETCAEVGRALDLSATSSGSAGKRARIMPTSATMCVGDVVEALLGAIYLEGGLEPADYFVAAPIGDRSSTTRSQAPVHPKSALQERAAAKSLGVPDYELVSRHGAHHAPRFKVKVSLGRHGEAEAEGASKQEAETAAAAALLEKLR